MSARSIHGSVRESVHGMFTPQTAEDITTAKSKLAQQVAANKAKRVGKQILTTPATPVSCKVRSFHKLP